MESDKELPRWLPLFKYSRRLGLPTRAWPKQSHQGYLREIERRVIRGKTIFNTFNFPTLRHFFIILFNYLFCRDLW